METREVEIQETILITPSPPPLLSTTILPLSHLDNDRNLRINIRTLRLYPPNAATTNIVNLDPFPVIAESLSKALFHYYPLAGTLVLDPSSDSRLSLSCSPGQGVPLTRAVSTRTVESLDAEPSSSSLLEKLAPDLTNGDELDRPLVLQVTQFACGGFVLGMCVHHAMCDGAGATQFLSAVAGFSRGEAGVTVEPVWDRSALLGPRRPLQVEVNFADLLGFDGKCSSCLYDRVVSSRETVITKEIFHVSEVCLDQFRTRLTKESSLSYTSFEALGAFIWRARVKATAIASDEVVKFAYSMNIRKLLKPSLPIGYWGNVCVPVYVKLTAKELLEQPLWETANLIKKSKHNVTDEYVRSYIDFQELHYKEGITAGNRVSGFTDWRHLGHSEVDFGWGSPRNVLPLSSRLLGSVEPTFFLAYAVDDGRKKDGFKVLVCLPQDAISTFRLDMENFSCCSK